MLIRGALTVVSNANKLRLSDLGEPNTLRDDLLLFEEPAGFICLSCVIVLGGCAFNNKPPMDKHSRLVLQCKLL